MTFLHSRTRKSHINWFEKNLVLKKAIFKKKYCDDLYILTFN